MDQLILSSKISNLVFHHTVEPPGKVTEYRPLKFEPIILHDGTVNQLAADWLNYYRDEGVELSTITRLKKQKNIPISWTDEKGAKHRKIVNLSAVIATIREHLHFSHSHLDIPAGSKVPWMDRSISATLDAYWPDNKNKTPGDTTLITLITELGEGFPLRPSIDREGFCYAPLMTYLYKAIANSRKYLVENSNQMFSLSDEWMQYFFTYFNACISLFESSLNQIYFKAKYDDKDANGRGKESGLVFDEAKMGSVITAQTMDKLRWIYLSTGKHLVDIGDEKRSIEIIKTVRNHINHFNPPVFACTAEDLAKWLNMARDIGKLLWKIRTLLYLPPSRELCLLLFAPRAVFVPRNPNNQRGTQKAVAGYASSCWGAAASAPVILSPAQCRGARAMLDWTPAKLAETAKLQESIISHFEQCNQGLTDKQLAAIKKAFQANGIEVLSTGEGIRFAESAPNR